LGDALTLVCGFFYAIHIIVTARIIDKRDPMMLAMLQFTTAGILSIIAAVITDPFPTTITSTDWWSIAFLTIVCTAGCLLMQAFGQKYTPPSQASVILTLESVLGALASVILIHELLTPRLVFGFILTFAAVLISETKLEFLRKRQ
jgi:drug/metabolite transporter (DMT)-like permease